MESTLEFQPIKEFLKNTTIPQYDFRNTFQSHKKGKKKKHLELGINIGKDNFVGNKSPSVQYNLFLIQWRLRWGREVIRGYSRDPHLLPRSWEKHKCWKTTGFCIIFITYEIKVYSKLHTKSWLLNSNWLKMCFKQSRRENISLIILGFQIFPSKSNIIVYKSHRNS